MADKKEPRLSFLEQANDAVRGVANGITFGLADKAEAATEALISGSSYKEQLTTQNDIDTKGGIVYEAGVVVGALIPAGKLIQGASIAVDAVRAGGIEKMSEIGAATFSTLRSATSKGNFISEEVSHMLSESEAELQNGLQHAAKFIEAHPKIVAPFIYGSSALKGAAYAGISTFVNFEHGDSTPHPIDTPTLPASSTAGKTPQK